jgi:hypothetical protein
MLLASYFAERGAKDEDETGRLASALPTYNTCFDSMEKISRMKRIM